MNLLRTCLVRKNTFLLKRPFRKPIANRKELLKKEFGRKKKTAKGTRAASAKPPLLIAAGASWKREKIPLFSDGRIRSVKYMYQWGSGEKVAVRRLLCGGRWRWRHDDLWRSQQPGRIKERGTKKSWVTIVINPPPNGRCRRETRHKRKERKMMTSIKQNGHRRREEKPTID